jgi:DNA-binding NarL/FixJ family response regulator
MNHGMAAIRALVLGDGPDLAESLAHILPRRGPVRVVGPVDARQAAAAFDAGEADLALVDVDRPDGIASIELLRSVSDRAVVLGLIEDDSADLLVSALVAGACGVVPRRLAPAQLLRAMHRAMAGELVIPERDLHRVVGSLHRAVPDIGDHARIESLTRRETEILLALTEGLSTSEIAKRLDIRVMTVQSHVKNLLAKLGVHSKVEAVTFAWRLGVSASSRSA